MPVQAGTRVSAVMMLPVRQVGKVEPRATVALAATGVLADSLPQHPAHQTTIALGQLANANALAVSMGSAVFYTLKTA
jgi:hypothetical protein